MRVRCSGYQSKEILRICVLEIHINQAIGHALHIHDLKKDRIFIPLVVKK